MKSKFFLLTILISLVAVAIESKATGISATFKTIPAGTFKMGSPADEIRRGSDETQHLVTLTKDFQIQTTEVTQLQYFLVMGANSSGFKKIRHCEKEHRIIDGTSLCPSLPVDALSWNRAQEFILKLNSSDNRYTYRLPTEAEWEYAARSGTTSPFNLGNDITSNEVNYNGNRPYYNDSPIQKYRGQTVAVGSLPSANDFGLYDMHGNVSEWVQDIYGGDYSSSHVTDPKGASSGSFRMLRGGNWISGARYVRSASRDRWFPHVGYVGMGIRLVRTAK